MNTDQLSKARAYVATYLTESERGHLFATGQDVDPEQIERYAALYDREVARVPAVDPIEDVNDLSPAALARSFGGLNE